MHRAGRDAYRHAEDDDYYITSGRIVRSGRSRANPFGNIRTV